MMCCLLGNLIAKKQTRNEPDNQNIRKGRPILPEKRLLVMQQNSFSKNEALEIDDKMMNN